MCRASAMVHETVHGCYWPATCGLLASLSTRGTEVVLMTGNAATETAEAAAAGRPAVVPQYADGRETNWLELPVSGKSAAIARSYTRSALRGWELDGDVVDCAGLVVSELVTNALKHAGSGGSIALRLALGSCGGPLVVAVRDGEPQLPNPGGAPADSSESGRGLDIVAQLSTRNGCAVGTDHKVMWAVLDVRGSSDADAGASPAHSHTDGRSSVSPEVADLVCHEGGGRVRSGSRNGISLADFDEAATPVIRLAPAAGEPTADTRLDSVILVQPPVLPRPLHRPCGATQRRRGASVRSSPALRLAQTYMRVRVCRCDTVPPQVVPDQRGSIK
jgi:anti-sigma regulatory factor (Ser/Thr protein kinase)